MKFLVKMNTTTIGILPTILVGVFITENTHLSILEAYILSWEHTKFIWRKGNQNVNIQPYFILGHPQLKHNFFKSHTYIIKMHENMNEGKTYFWFKKAIQIFQSKRIPYHPLNGIIKMDSDCAVNWTYFNDNVVERLPFNYYFGRAFHTGDCALLSICPPSVFHNFFNIKHWTWMQGGFYGLSLSIVQHLMQCEFARTHTVGPEDVQVGLWVEHCSKSKIQYYDIQPGHLFCHSKLLTAHHIKNMYFRDICKNN